MAIELADAYVSIIPSAAGIANVLAEEMGAPLEQAAQEAGEKASSGFGKAFAVGMAAAVAVGVVALEKIGSTFDDAGDKIRITTGATGVALDSLNESFKNVVSTVPADFGDASTAISVLNQKLGLTGAPLEAVAEQVLNLSRLTGTDLAANVDATADVFNSWGVSVADQVPKLDELFRVSQATGVSVGDLATQMAENGVKARAVGLSYEQTAALFGLLAKNGLSAADVMPAISRAMASAASQGKDANVVFHETFDAIKNAPNDTAAAAAALEVFGAKAGPQMAALIREGKVSYEELAASIAAGGDTIGDAAADTDDWREKLKLLVNKGMIAIEPIATKVFDTIGRVVEAVTPFVRTVVSWLGERLPVAMAAVSTWVKSNWPTIKAVIVGVFDAVKSAVMFFVEEVVPRVVDGVKATFGWLMDNKEVLVGIAIGLTAALGTLFAIWAAGAISAAAATIAAAAPFIAIGVAVAAVAAGVIYAYNHFETFRTVVDAVASFFTDTLWPILQDVFFWFRDNVPPIVQTVIDVFTWLWNNVLSPLTSFLTTVFSIAWAVVKLQIDIVTTAVGALITAGTWLWNNVLSPLVSFLSDVFSLAWAAVQLQIDLVTAAFGFVSDAVSVLWHDFLEPVGTFLGDAFGLALSGVITAVTAVGTAFSTLKTMASDAVTGVVDFIKGLPGKLLALVQTFVLAGASLGSHILQGFKDGLSAIAGFAGDVAESIMGAVKDAWNTVAGLINNFIPNSLGWGPFSIDLPDNPIPTFATGGIVGGPTLAVIGDAPGGEAVMNRPQMQQFAQFAGLELNGGSGYPDHMTLIIEGMPFTAIVQRNNNELASALTAGRRK